MAVGDIVQAVVVSTLHGQTLMNRYHYVCDQGIGDLSNFGDKFGNLVRDQITTISSNELTINRVDIHKISPRPVTYTLTFVVNAPGVGTQPSIPVNTAYCVTKITQYAGHKYRGRWYIGGLGTQAVAGSQILGPQLAQLQVVWDLFGTVLTAANNDKWWPVLSHGYVPNTDVISYDKLTKVIVRPILRNQRKRQVGVGI